MDELFLSEEPRASPVNLFEVLISPHNDTNSCSDESDKEMMKLSISMKRKLLRRAQIFQMQCREEKIQPD
jgi:hypothetical protein